jgi:chloramphenicol 3-O-phosphotransferase
MRPRGWSTLDRPLVCDHADEATNNTSLKTQVIVLSGGSSSGKSPIARALQDILVAPWITLGVDDLLAGLSPALARDAQPRPGAASQAVRVHDGVRYDVVVDSTTTSSLECARAIVARVDQRR